MAVGETTAAEEPSRFLCLCIERGTHTIVPFRHPAIAVSHVSMDEEGAGRTND